MFYTSTDYRRSDTILGHYWSLGSYQQYHIYTAQPESTDVGSLLGLIRAIVFLRWRHFSGKCSPKFDSQLFLGSLVRGNSAFTLSTNCCCYIGPWSYKNAIGFLLGSGDKHIQRLNKKESFEGVVVLYCGNFVH